MPRPPVPTRRAILAGSLAALLAPRTTRAQPTRHARIGLLGSSSEENFVDNLRVFRKRMHDLGWIEGQNLTIEARYANERYEQLPELAAGLVKLGVDVIFAMAVPAVRAAKRATTTIPIVIETLGDAVGTGLVSNLARPGGNVTGVSGFAPELSGKRLEILRELSPTITRVAVLANRANPATPAVVRSLEAAAQQMRMQLLITDVATTAGLPAAFERIVRERGEAFVVAADPIIFNPRRTLVELAARHRLPAVYEYRAFVELGGLLSYGPDSHERFQQAAVYIDRILRGAKPGDLPVEQPRTFELTLNLATARRMGLTIPAALRVRADHVIE
jgi:putative tryptophan/tyrosine transport system substrate-binding protein